MTLQHAQVVYILRCAIVGGEGSLTLDILSRGPPLSLFDMLFIIGGGLRTWCFPLGSTS
jgi:hypothetical protein